jgi:peptidyl-prolyl cis-trans isomerase A (cyclophilin A)
MFKKILIAASTLLFTAQLMAAQPASASKPHVLLHTSNGAIELELDGEKAPLSTRNFLAYVDKGFYSNTLFHRVIPKFMIQGGGFTQAMQQKPTEAAIKNEADNGLKNARGTIAMARTSDINSATSQFFINHADNEMLDHRQGDFGYAVFGKVVKGMEVVDIIANSNTTTKNGMQNVPVDPVVILSAKRID